MTTSSRFDPLAPLCAHDQTITAVARLHAGKILVGDIKGFVKSQPKGINISISQSPIRGIAPLEQDQLLTVSDNGSVRIHDLRYLKQSLYEGKGLIREKHLRPCFLVVGKELIQGEVEPPIDLKYKTYGLWNIWLRFSGSLAGQYNPIYSLSRDESVVTIWNHKKISTRQEDPEQIQWFPTKASEEEKKIIYNLYTNSLTARVFGTTYSIDRFFSKSGKR